ncbi:hypothetical protein [Lachnospira sp.]|jgi:hypothetical protein|uniref:hypothetical protein n=1 Tax=Lachnospira sp. TaxID=2049031 RepID=UPI00257B8742|nr:hypothetical protein [Lachnospira sp.]
MGLGAIIDGHIKEFVGQNGDLSKWRMDICRECPLFKVMPLAGPICNNNKYLNVQTGDVSNTPKIGYRRGCGCRLNAKTRVAKSKCPLGKW